MVARLEFLVPNTEYALKQTCQAKEVDGRDDLDMIIEVKQCAE